MELYCVYENPSDYLGKYVVRKWFNNQPKLIPEALGDDLEKVRQVIPKHFIKLDRSPDDDPVILETWI